MKMLYYITFRSGTHAQRAERALREGGYRSILRRTPRWMEEKGCGYCLQMVAEDILPPVQLLQNGGIPLRRVYAQKENGGIQEVQL